MSMIQANRPPVFTTTKPQQKTENTKRPFPKITPEEELAIERSWLNKADKTGTIPWPTA